MDHLHGNWNQCLEYAALSDVGLRRANNQDSFAVTLAGDQADFEQRGHFFMVADGMGAHAAGELASKMATDAVALSYRKRLDQPPAEALVSAVVDANHQIHTRGQASPDFRGMGTTATSLVLLPAGAMVAHVGDSRAYRVRGDKVEQLTFDHSLVWEIRAASQTPGAEVPSYISKNIITRSLGPSPAVQIDLEGPFPLETGDCFMLCSDGLSNQVKDEEIGVILSNLAPRDAARALVDLALLRGGPDNITVVIAKVLGPQVAKAPEPGEAAPIRVRPVHPAVWTVLVLATLAGLTMLTLGSVLLAMLAFAAAAVSAVVAMVQRYSGADTYSEDGQTRFGRGPYVTCSAAPSPEVLERWNALLGQLRDSGAKENWPIEWTAFDEAVAQAAASIDAHKPRDAASQMLKAVSQLLAQRRHPRDS